MTSQSKAYDQYFHHGPEIENTYTDSDYNPNIENTYPFQSKSLISNELIFWMFTVFLLILSIILAVFTGITWKEKDNSDVNKYGFLTGTVISFLLFISLLIQRLIKDNLPKQIVKSTEKNEDQQIAYKKAADLWKEDTQESR